MRSEVACESLTALTAEELRHFRAAESRLATGQSMKALCELKKIRSPHDAHFQARLLLGHIHLASGNLVEAVRTFYALTKSEPEVPSTWFGLAVAFARCDDAIAAELALKSCLRAADRIGEWDQWTLHMNRYHDVEFSKVWTFHLLQRT